MNDNLRPAQGTVVHLRLNGARGLSRGSAMSLRSLLDGFWRWHEGRRQRQHLARLDDRALDDLGISREEAARAAEAWFWRF